MTESARNLCDLHRTMCRRMGDKTAWRYQVSGHYQDISFQDVWGWAGRLDKTVPRSGPTCTVI